MKKSLLCLFVTLLAAKGFSQLTFTITNHTGSNILTCKTTSISFSAMSNSAGVTYVWSNGNSTQTGSSVNLTSPGIYTVAAIASNSTTATQTLLVNSSTNAPVPAISPTFQNITCNQSSIITVTSLVNNNNNVTQQVLSPNGGTVQSTSSSLFYIPSVGVFTVLVTDNINGCMSVSNFTVSSNSGVPTYSLMSPQNFTLGCSTKSAAVVLIANGNTTPPGGSVSYTLLAPGMSTVLPNTPLSSQNVYTVTTPGVYIAVTRDNASLCETWTRFSVLSNTLAPQFAVAAHPSVLTCDTSDIVMNASSNVNSSFIWTFPMAPGSSPQSTVAVFTNTLAPTSTLIANYTLTVTDNSSLCKSATIVPVYQNIFPPKPIISTGGNYSLTCSTPTIVLTNQSMSGIPPGNFPNSAPVVATLWSGPSPQVPATFTSSYIAYTPGTYTLKVRDNNNGCVSSTVAMISDGRDYPVLSQNTVVCLSNGSAVISPVISSTSSLTYTWTSPANATVSGANSGALTTNSTGTYTLNVKSGTSGCVTEGQFLVVNCTGLTENPGVGSFNVYPNPTAGSVRIESLKGRNITVSVFNVLGSLISEESFGSGSGNIDLTEQAAGIYLFKISDNSGSSATIRVIRQ